MKTATLTASIKYGLAAAAVDAWRSRCPRARTTPIADRDGTVRHPDGPARGRAAIPQPAPRGLPELHRRRGGPFPAEPGRQDPGGPLRGPELARSSPTAPSTPPLRPSSCSSMTSAGRTARRRATQVIQQTNAHVGLAFSPDGNTLYAAGRARRLHLRLQQGGRHLDARRRAGPRPRQQGDRDRRQPQRRRPGDVGRRQDPGGRQQLQRLDQRHRHGERNGPLRARPAPVLQRQRRGHRRRGRHLPVRRGREGQHASRTCRPTAIAR